MAGAAIAIAQHTHNQPVNVTITGGEFNGYNAFYQADPQGNTESVAEFSIAIEGGEFNANGGTSVHSKNSTGFITGGTFSTEPDETYIVQGYAAKQSGNGWVVGPSA